MESVVYAEGDSTLVIEPRAVKKGMTWAWCYRAAAEILESGIAPHEDVLVDQSLVASDPARIFVRVRPDMLRVTKAMLESLVVRMGGG
jgi:hypothetical protein